MLTRNDLAKKTVRELKEICKDSGIKGYSSLKKSSLISLILKNKEKIHDDGISSEDGGDLSREGKSLDDLERAIAKKFFNAREKSTNSNDQSIIKEIDGKKKVKFDETKLSFKKLVEVDFWATNLHGAEIGIFQKERYMAKNRSFTRSLELVGMVKDKGKANGIFGYQADSWDEIPNNNLTKKRLVLKWFNEKSVAHLGTLEEIVIDSLCFSIASTDTMPLFKMIIPRYDYVVNIKKGRPKPPGLGEIFTFPLWIEKKNKWEVIILDEKRFTIGSDWIIKKPDGEILGKIDEKVMNVGGKFNVWFYNEQYYKLLPFYRIILLFTMMLGFKKKILNKIEKTIKLMKSGRINITLDTDEELFMRNPRLLKR
ncbi:MAG: Rho termination factor N-terminal domain-containing protein [Promethearchaeota archaeon]